MTQRRILRVRDRQYSLADEAPFASEAELQRAVAQHPEVLPADELGLGTLVSVAVELDLGSGPMDLLAVDASGRAVIVEFKRGLENPDVRKVVAQMLDYGSALWRTTYTEVEEACARLGQLTGDSLVDHVASALMGLGEELDPDAFRAGLEATLSSGDFVFLYVARDLDQRTRRIMTFLGEGPRLSMFAVEVDNYAFDRTDAVLVPRVGFVPTWVADHGASRIRPTRQRLAELLEAAADDVHEVDRRLAVIAHELGGVVVDSDKARNYRPAKGRMAIALYPHWRSVHFWLRSMRDRGEDALAEKLRDAISQLYPERQPARDDPSLPVDVLLRHWDVAERTLLRPYFAARVQHVKADVEP